MQKFGCLILVIVIVLTFGLPLSPARFDFGLMPSLPFWAVLTTSTFLLAYAIEVLTRAASRMLLPRVIGWFLFAITLGVTSMIALSYVEPVIVAGCTVLLAIAAMVIAMLRRETRRLQCVVAGWCEDCGYDLRGSPDRCPECGAPLPEEIRRRRRIATELKARRTATAAANLGVT